MKPVEPVPTETIEDSGSVLECLLTLKANTVHLGWKRFVSPCQIPPSPLC
jgi:hypothetical protein